MTDGQDQRRLAAVLAADMVGYTRLMERDSEGTVAAWKDARAQHIDPTIEEHGGRIVKHTGDGFLAEFHTVRAAVDCAVELQKKLAGGPLAFRMGVDLGDIIDDGEDIHGEGVNVAERIEPLADAGGIMVSGAVYEQVRNQLDVVFEDCGAYRVKNVSAPVRVYAVCSTGVATPRWSRARPAVAAVLLLVLLAAGGWWWSQRIDVEPAEPARLAYALPAKPSIAVLPFANLSGDTSHEFLAVGFSEDVLTSLSKLSGLFVISGSTSLKLAGTEPRQVAEDLGVRYVLSGSLQRSEDRIRVSARLIDAIEGRFVWSDRYDRDIADLFAVKDQVTLEIVANVGAQLELGERDRLRGRETRSLEAWLLQREGYRAVQKFNAEDNAVGRRLLERAITLDPRFATAYANLALSYKLDFQLGWVEDRQAALAKSRALFEQALAIDPEHGPATASLASWHLAVGDVATARRIARRAVELEPSDYFVHAIHGWTLMHSDAADEAVKELNLSLRLSPRGPDWVLYKLSEAYLIAGDATSAARVAKQPLDRPPPSTSTENLAHIMHALALDALGDTEAAKQAAAAAVAVFPKRTRAVWTRQRRYVDPAAQAALSATLEKLGMP